MNYKCQTYVRKGRPTMEVDKEYFTYIQEGSELLEILQAHGVEEWEGYDDAKKEYDDEVND